MISFVRQWTPSTENKNLAEAYSMLLHSSGQTIFAPDIQQRWVLRSTTCKWSLALSSYLFHLQGLYLGHKKPNPLPYSLFAHLGAACQFLLRPVRFQKVKWHEKSVKGSRRWSNAGLRNVSSEKIFPDFTANKRRWAVERLESSNVGCLFDSLLSWDMGVCQEQPNALDIINC